MCFVKLCYLRARQDTKRSQKEHAVHYGNHMPATKQQFPRPQLLTPDDDHFGPNKS
jgi:hypothetical protein